MCIRDRPSNAEEFLLRATAFATWSGRYPYPKDGGAVPVTYRMSLSSDPGTFKRLYRALEKQLASVRAGT